jgi:hypothetical protein
MHNTKIHLERRIYSFLIFLIYALKKNGSVLIYKVEERPVISGQVDNLTIHNSFEKVFQKVVSKYVSHIERLSVGRQEVEMCSFCNQNLTNSTYPSLFLSDYNRFPLLPAMQ